MSEKSSHVEGKEKKSTNKVSIKPFLDDNLRDILDEGLKKIAKERPENPIKFLGNFLISKS